MCAVVKLANILSVALISEELLENTKSLLWARKSRYIKAAYILNGFGIFLLNTQLWFSYCPLQKIQPRNLLSQQVLESVIYFELLYVHWLLLFFNSISFVNDLVKSVKPKPSVAKWTFISCCTSFVKNLIRFFNLISSELFWSDSTRFSEKGLKNSEDLCHNHIISSGKQDSIIGYNIAAYLSLVIYCVSTERS